MVQIKEQKKQVAALAVAGAFALAALVPTQASAAPVNIVAGDTIRVYDGPGSTGGGEFWADVVGKGVSGTINAGNNDFIAFCLEFNETLQYNVNLKVAAVNTGSVNGGVSGQTSTNFDPISAETAWLYTQAMTNPGVLTGGYAHSQAKANSLQRAIWFLEGELGASYTEAQLNSLDSQAKTWVDQAQASGWTTIGNVRVLNLQRYAGGQWVNAQDQLWISPIPEPETYAMLLAGLGLMGFVARRRKSRASQG
jgi:hypothetical protein